MRIECIPVERIEQFAREACRSRVGGGVVPISPHRARAWARNPLARPEDRALLVALEGDRCLGYLGLFPGLLRTPAGERRIEWISTWFVHPEARSSGAGARLLAGAVATQRDLAVTWINPRAARAMQAFGFQPLGPLRYLSADLVGRDLLSGPWRALRRLSRAVRRRHTPLLDRLVHASRSPRKAAIHRSLLRATAEQRRRLEARPIHRLEAPAEGADRPAPSAGAHFHRPAVVVNWMLADPWVTTRHDQATVGYRFADWQPCFGYLPFELHEAEGGRLGTVVLRLSTRHTNRILTVLDCALSPATPAGSILALAVWLANKHEADRLVLPISEAGAVDELGPGRALFTEASRRYFYRSAPGSPLQPGQTDVELALADGDYAFA